jgi:hypothetical protein
MCSMRPVRRLRVRGAGRALTRREWNLLLLCRYRRPAAPQTGEVTKAVRGSVGSGVCLRHPLPSLPCGHLCGHSGAALRILARTHTEKPPSSDGGFLCLIQAVTDSGGLAQKPCQPLCRPLPYHLATAPKDSKPNVRQQVPQSGRRHCPVWTYGRSGCRRDCFESRDGMISESRAA